MATKQEKTPIAILNRTRAPIELPLRHVQVGKLKSTDVVCLLPGRIVDIGDGAEMALDQATALLSSPILEGWIAQGIIEVYYDEREKTAAQKRAELSSKGLAA